MLVLDFVLEERAFLGDDIVITVLEVHGGRVKLGFDAPLELPIHREKVYWKLKGQAPRHRRGRKPGKLQHEG